MEAFVFCTDTVAPYSHPKSKLIYITWSAPVALSYTNHLYSLEDASWETQDSKKKGLSLSWLYWDG